MGLTCKLFGHKWTGCKCERCGATRDAGHFWNGCTCARCGKVRDELHDWHAGKCRRCGKEKELTLPKFVVKSGS